MASECQGEPWTVCEHYDEAVDGTCFPDGYSVNSGKKLVADVYTRDNAYKIAAVLEMLEALYMMRHDFQQLVAVPRAFHLSPGWKLP